MHDDEVCECCGWRPEPDWMMDTQALERAIAPQWALDWEDTILCRLKLETFIGDRETQT